MSEIEVRSVTEYMTNLVNSGEDIRVFIDFHSYGQMWMSPWGYTENSRPDDFDDQNNLLADAVAAVVAAYGTNYTHGPIANTMYVASGNSVDWTYGALGITYSYVVELRDKGWYGFSLLRSLIVIETPLKQLM
ncbi:carboxypeptidase B-like [Anneissia japonica]|uniref:carboxypeptidase B-like n=1 Tax=Anneissia japonica TaxID=1529436 RepID=UPI0014255CC2|nr:carboxypeptidase B-like [Anneissia japonica]